jgi:hypothetical protein
MTNRTKTIVGFALGVALAAPLTARAQRWGSERPPRDGVCFYRDADFRGDYFCARAGETLASVPHELNNSISSIRIFGRAEVTVFRDFRFDGPSARFDDDVRNLRQEHWNDRISSIRVRHSSRDHDRRSDDRGYSGRDDDRGYSGRHQDADDIVRRAYRDILEREPDGPGLRLYRSRIIDDGWTERQVREALRTSPEYRERHAMTRERAEEIVRHAYLAVLHREPDSESRGYVDRVLRDKWTQQDVERELRRSAEYRNRNR